MGDHIRNYFPDFFVQSMPFSFIGSGITKNFLARVCDFLLEKQKSRNIAKIFGNTSALKTIRPWSSN